MLSWYSVLVKITAAAHFCKQVPFSQEKLLKFNGTINEICVGKAYGTECMIKDWKT